MKRAGPGLIIWVWLALAGLHADSLAVFRTPLGDLDVQLYGQDKPVTVGNFVRYVDAGAYQDSFFHRAPVSWSGTEWIVNFVIQGGGLWVTNRATPNWRFAMVPTFPPIPNEYSTGRRFTNGYGTIAMAKVAGNTNSAGSQWFFNLRNNFELDAHDTNNLFVVFGRVIRGTNVLEKVKKFRGYTGVEKSNVVEDLGFEPVRELPLLAPVLPAEVSTKLLSYLLWTDISLLRVVVAVDPAGVRNLTWSSVRDVTNRVEYAPAPGAGWETVATRMGTGGSITVVDARSVGAGGVYRVAVDYP